MRVTCRHCPATYDATAATFKRMMEIHTADRLALPIVDGWLIALDERFAYCPQHVDLVEITHPTPTSQPCPTWCTRGDGHPYDEATATTDPEHADSRVHERLIGDPDGQHVILAAIERVRVDATGVHVEIVEPQVELDDGRLLTCSEAAQIRDQFGGHHPLQELLDEALTLAGVTG